MCVGGAELAYQYAFHLQDRRDATVAQHLTASVVGSVASIAVSAPLDTIKTRIQNQNFGSNVRGTHVFKELIQHEGVTALVSNTTSARNIHCYRHLHTLIHMSSPVFVSLYLCVCLSICDYPSFLSGRD
jgi:hypothetical protein